MKKLWLCFCLTLVALSCVQSPLMAQAPMRVQWQSGFHGQPSNFHVVPDSLLQESRQGFWLVEAKCLSISAEPENIAQWQVSKVFNGPEELKEQEFKASHYQGGSFNTPPLSFVPKANDRGLWVVVLQNENVRLPFFNKMSVGEYWRLVYGEYFPVSPSQRQVFGLSGFFRDEKFRQPEASYAQALLYAQSIERVARAPRNEQIRLLGVYAKSAMPQRSAWAIATLAESGLESAPRLLIELAHDAKIPIEGQLALDRGLALLDSQKKVIWNSTSTRLALWRRLLDARVDGEQAGSIVYELRQIAQREGKLLPSGIGPSRVFKWLRQIAQNSRWDTLSRNSAVLAIGDMTQANTFSREEAWKFLVGVLKTHPELARGAKTSDFAVQKPLSTQAILAGNALKTLSRLRPFSSEELQTLRALQTRAKTPFLRSLFEQILEPAK